jgi:hypothetical protein
MALFLGERQGEKMLDQEFEREAALIEKMKEINPPERYEYHEEGDLHGSYIIKWTKTRDNIFWMVRLAVTDRTLTIDIGGDAEDQFSPPYEVWRSEVSANQSMDTVLEDLDVQDAVGLLDSWDRGNLVETRQRTQAVPGTGGRVLKVE